MRRILVILFMMTVAALLLWTLVSDVFCRSTLRVPRRASGGMPPGVAWRELAVTARDGATLRGWFAGTSENCVMVLHGIADSSRGAAGFAPMFLDAGYAVLVPDARAHGRSGGELVTYGLLERYDALLWAHTMRQQGCIRLYGLGESLGAAVLIQAVAVEPAFRALVAECSYADLRSIGEYRVRQMTGRAAPLAGLIVGSAIVYARLRYSLDFNDASPVTSIARTSVPILLIHGLVDDRTPAAHSERLSRASPQAALWLVPGAGHVQASRAAPREFRERTLGWFAANR